MGTRRRRASGLLAAALGALLVVAAVPAAASGQSDEPSSRSGGDGDGGGAGPSARAYEERAEGEPTPGPWLHPTSEMVVGLQPSRLLDTRDGTGAPIGPLEGGQAMTLQVTGRGGVPDVGVGAVVLNVTGTQADEPSFITAWPTGAPRPNASNLNLEPGADTPNAVVVKVGRDGRIDLFNYAGSTELIADVTGWIPTGFAFTPLVPHRVLDTRDGTGGTVGPVAGGSEIALDVTGVGGVPEAGVAAVVLNVTGTEASEPTFVTVWPEGPRPLASNLNLQPGSNTPNLVMTKVGANGEVRLFNYSGQTHLIADVAGWIPEGPSYEPLVPGRVLDTRDGTGGTLGAVSGGQSISVDVTGGHGVPDEGVGSVVLNVTASEVTEPSFVTVWPDGTRPNSSSLNLRPGVDTPNLVVTKVGGDGSVRLFNYAGSAQLIADVVGWIPSGGTSASVQLEAGTTLVGDADVLSIDGGSDIPSTVVLSPTSPVPMLDGHLVVSGVPGFLGRVATVELNADGSVTVTTIPSTVDAAFAVLDLTYQGPLEGLAEVPATGFAGADPGPEGRAVEGSLGTSWRDGLLGCSGLAVSSLGGGVGFSGTDVDFSFRRGFLGLEPRMRAVLTTNVRAELTAGITGSGSCSMNAAAKWIPVPIGPVWVTVEIGPRIGLSAEGNASFNAVASGPVRLGLDAGPLGTEEISDIGIGVSTNLDVEASVSLTAGAFVAFKAFGAVGVDLFAGPKWKGTAQYGSTPCLSVSQFVNVSASLVAGAFGFDASVGVSGDFFEQVIYTRNTCSQQPPPSVGITFSELPVGTPISNQYYPSGILFRGDSPFITTDGANPTSPVLSGSPLFFGAIEGWFVVPGSYTARTVDSFALDVGYLDNSGSVAVSFYDINGRRIGYRTTYELGIQRFHLAYPGIAGFRVEAVGEEAAGFAIDNVTF